MASFNKYLHFLSNSVFFSVLVLVHKLGRPPRGPRTPLWEPLVWKVVKGSTTIKSVKNLVQRQKFNSHSMMILLFPWCLAAGVYCITDIFSIHFNHIRSRMSKQKKCVHGLSVFDKALHRAYVFSLIASIVKRQKNIRCSMCIISLGFISLSLGCARDRMGRPVDA